jgi:glycosyltransferase involved in cell wall biosynthesis
MSGLVVHEWMAHIGGSERVVEAMLDLHPDADLLCLWADDLGRLSGHRVRQTWLARTPLRGRKAAALPLMPVTWRCTRLPKYDWMLVSSHVFAHHVSGGRENRGTAKFVYVHSPARYIWDADVDERGRHPVVRAAATVLRPLDRRRAQEPVAIAVNSEFVRARVQRAWGRDATVIHPPVDTDAIVGVDWASRCTDQERSLLDALPRPYLLGASRFVPYKRLDLVVDTGEAAGMPVVLAGGGPQREALEHRAAEASVPVQFVADPSDALLYALYQHAHAYVFPAVEDFGIMPVEAMATGTPVIVNGTGGASESVVHGRTGHHLDSFAPADLKEAVVAVEGLRPDDCVERAADFGVTRFQAELTAWMR